MKKMCVIACHVLWRELSYFASQSPHSFQYKFLKQGLHNVPDQLRQELQAAIDEVDGQYDAILIGYGLCSNGLMGIQARNTRLVVMRGHDCITFLLGSKERYREYFDTHPGTYWYSPGWIETSTQPGEERYNKVLQSYTEIYGEENAKFLMEATENWMTCYSMATYVDLGVGDTAGHKAFTAECARWLGWNDEYLEGDTQLVRDFVNGNWDDNERFLVVEPGETIMPSHDALIIKAEKA